MKKLLTALAATVMLSTPAYADSKTDLLAEIKATREAVTLHTNKLCDIIRDMPDDDLNKLSELKDEDGEEVGNLMLFILDGLVNASIGATSAEKILEGN